jgi:plastocyanin
MKQHTKFTAGTAIALIVGAVALAIASAQAGQAQGQAQGQPQAQAGAQAQGDSPIIEISAKKYEFNPAEIHVKNGTHIRLKFTATDRDHGVSFDVYPKGSNKKGDPGLVFSAEKPSFKLTKGEAQTIEFDAKQPGTYETHCAVFCGLGHHGMKGAIIVDP